MSTLDEYTGMSTVRSTGNEYSDEYSDEYTVMSTVMSTVIVHSDEGSEWAVNGQ